MDKKHKILYVINQTSDLKFDVDISNVILWSKDNIDTNNKIQSIFTMIEENSSYVISEYNNFTKYIYEIINSSIGLSKFLNTSDGINFYSLSSFHYAFNLNDN